MKKKGRAVVSSTIWRVKKEKRGTSGGGVEGSLFTGAGGAKFSAALCQ